MPVGQDAPTATPQPEATIFPAVLTRSVTPEYPRGCDASAADVESVTLIFDVGVNGRVANARVASSTNSCFETEALSTITRWRFNPRSVNGAPTVDAGKTATLNFRK